MSVDYEDFITSVMAHVGGDDARVAQTNVRRYFDPSGPFTGSEFENLTDSTHPDSITAADLVAVSTLREVVSPPVAIWLLRDATQQAIEQLLARVPTDVDLWDRPDLVEEGGDLARLRDLLQYEDEPEAGTDPRMSVSMTSKLLAAKRPRVVPILQTLYTSTLPRVQSQWDAFARVVADPDRRALISEATVGAPDHVSLLRRLDLVLWMAHRDDNGPTRPRDRETERVLATTDIVEVIGAVVPLKPSGGRRMVGPCPFDPEVTGPLFVSRDRGLFFCFNCGAQGDVIDFERRFWNVDHEQAVTRLAPRAGLHHAPRPPSSTT